MIVLQARSLKRSIKRELPRDDRDICRRNAGFCKQQPNLTPIQRERERVILRWKYHEDSR